MKNSMRFFIGISLLVLVVCYGCGVEKSEAEMKAAQQAKDKAEAVYAKDLAPSNWNEAMVAWEQGQAAVKEGKPAKTYLIRAKSRFEKTAIIAKAEGEKIAADVKAMQETITQRFGKVKAAMNGGKVSPKARKQLQPVMAELEEGIAGVDSLAGQGNYLKARTLAKDIQMKVYSAELILQGKKPK
jgi:hypothetical protein